MVDLAVEAPMAHHEYAQAFRRHGAAGSPGRLQLVTADRFAPTLELPVAAATAADERKQESGDGEAPHPSRSTTSPIPSWSESAWLGFGVFGALSKASASATSPAVIATPAG